jgi:MFS family permease
MTIIHPIVLWNSDFSDRYGRKPVMWWSLGLAIVTMAVKTYLSHVYWAYVLLKLIAGGCFCAIYQVSRGELKYIALYSLDKLGNWKTQRTIKGRKHLS